VKLTKTQVRAIVAAFVALYVALQQLGIAMPEWLLVIVTLLAQELGIAVPTPGGVGGGKDGQVFEGGAEVDG
jgi:hypothetical protein